jgi:nitric oxide reductase large subunit
MLDESQHVKMRATMVFPVFYVLLHSLVIASCDWKVGGVPEGTASQLPKPRNYLQGKELQIVAGHVSSFDICDNYSTAKSIDYKIINNLIVSTTDCNFKKFFRTSNWIFWRVGSPTPLSVPEVKIHVSKISIRLSLNY